MMVITKKVRKRDLWILLAAVAAIAAVLLIPGRKKAPADTVWKAETNEQRVAFLSSFGWEVEPSPVRTQELRVPTGENAVFSRYNELQKYQGYDLTQYAGKTVKRYIYKITNYPGSDEGWYATVLVSGSRVVGGDVASAKKGGIMHSLKMPA